MLFDSLTATPYSSPPEVDRLWVYVGFLFMMLGKSIRWSKLQGLGFRGQHFRVPYNMAPRMLTLRQRKHSDVQTYFFSLLPDMVSARVFSTNPGPGVEPRNGAFKGCKRLDALG